MVTEDALQIKDWGVLRRTSPKACFGGGGFDEVKDEGGCNAKHCGRGVDCEAIGSVAKQKLKGIRSNDK